MPDLTQDELSLMADRYYDEIRAIPHRDGFSCQMHFGTLSVACMTTVVRLCGVGITGRPISDELMLLARKSGYDAIEKTIKEYVESRN